MCLTLTLTLMVSDDAVPDLSVHRLETVASKTLTAGT